MRMKRPPEQLDASQVVYASLPESRVEIVATSTDVLALITSAFLNALNSELLAHSQPYLADYMWSESSRDSQSWVNMHMRQDLS